MLHLNGYFFCQCRESRAAYFWGSRIPIRSEVKNRIRIKMKSRKLWRLTMAFHLDENPDPHKKLDPHPHQKQYPEQDEESDPDLHQSEKPDPDPDRSENPDPDPNTI